MTAESEGLRIARERIAREKAERSGFLDLGCLGLGQWPEEIWELDHLTALNLGSAWRENDKWREAASHLPPNSLSPYNARWDRFPNLNLLFAVKLFWRDLSPLAGLASLQSLDCSGNGLTTLDGLAGLSSLQSLVCSWNSLTTLEPLAGLASLQSLDCSGNRLTTLEPLGGLTSLQSLGCSWNPLTTLEPLAGLASLQSLDCSSNRLTTLEPLAGLASLQSLNCSSNRLTTLEPLAGLSSLQSLVCSWNSLTTLEPLAGLSSLQSLVCHSNGLTTLEPLAGLTFLKSLECSGNGLATLEPLAGLASLQFLDCSGNPLATLEPLTGLASLKSLVCSGNPLTTLEPLAGLSSLQSLVCSWNSLTTLEPLAGLSSLQSLVCHSNGLTTLEPLAGLASLQSLDCSRNPLTTLEPLAGLTSLQSLECSGNRLTTLEPLAGLASLQFLDCSRNQLTMLAGLASLRSLNCSGNLLATLEPLAGLASLQFLDCSRNQLTTLEPLAGLAFLRSLDCSGNPLLVLPPAIIRRETLQELIVFNTAVPDIPVEVLSKNSHSSCLETLRAHLRDLESGTDPLPDVKVMVLGNGRIGKTQLCNRLRELPFEPDADSTHGITVASREFGPDILLRLWDFGGQDIYHGIHALFMQSRAVFILVWTPDSENSETHEHGGMIFRNRPLAWWLAWARHLAGCESPVLVIQNRCDQPQDRRHLPPVPVKELNAFAFCQALPYSALNRRGEPALRDALHQAVAWLREQQGQARIGRGRLAVKARLDALMAEDAAIADASQRRHRTLSMERYEQICAECGGVSSTTLLLDYLHRSGVVFHKPGLFGNRIILDQGWALEAVYAVFNRRACYQPLKALRGRFTRTLLESLVWQNHSRQEQELFLDLMRSCGICFLHRQGDDELDIEPEYLAPDLLPDYAEVETEVQAQWNEAVMDDEKTLELPFLHPGVMRGLLFRIGSAAGMTAVYWRDGVCLYEKTTASHGRVEQRLHGSATEWRGSLVVRAQGGRSGDLLDLLWKWVAAAAEQSGLQIPPLPAADDAPSLAAAVPATENPPPKLAVSAPEFAPAPRTGITYAVSYAWRGESVKAVEDLCQHARTLGIHILRDVDDLGLGDRISRFMASIARQDRVFVILSDRYLRSENCMFELMEIWRRCQQEEENFHRQVRVYTMPDTDITSFAYQLEIIQHWGRQQDAVAPLVAELVGKSRVTEALLRRFNNLNAFARHAGEIIPYIADRLRPKDFAEFLKNGFSD